MNKLLLSILFFFLFSNVHANEICSRSQSDIKQRLADSNSRISFKNTGGLFNGGVCWWHSRLQRSSLYLVKYAPERSLPTKVEVQNILASLRLMDRVVTIPGYSDFESFSRDHKNEIQRMLNSWQKSDGFFNFQWLRGISGHSSLPAQEMIKRMDTVYKQFNSSPVPVWLMAQIKGITSHSLLLIGIKKTSFGYDLDVIDSNHPLKDIKIEFYKGDTSLRAVGEDYSFVPYVGFQNDFKKISQALKKSCGPNISNFLMNFENIPRGEVEID